MRHCQVPDCSKEAVYAIVFRTAEMQEQTEVCFDCLTAINFALDRLGHKSTGVSFYNIEHEKSPLKYYGHKEDK